MDELVCVVCVKGRYTVEKLWKLSSIKYVINDQMVFSFNLTFNSEIKNGIKYRVRQFIPIEWATTK